MFELQSLPGARIAKEEIQKQKEESKPVCSFFSITVFKTNDFCDHRLRNQLNVVNW